MKHDATSFFAQTTLQGDRIKIKTGEAQRFITFLQNNFVGSHNKPKLSTNRFQIKTKT